MMLGTRLRSWATAGNDNTALSKVSRVQAGHALLLHLEDHPNPRAVDFAHAIAPDPDHTLVVLDVPSDGPIELWHAVAGLLGRRRGGYRLVLGTHSRDVAMMTGQWLAERLGCPVLVPDGDVVLAPGGALFSSAPQATGWVRFRKGRAPQQDSRRFPVPDWTFPGTEQIWQPGPVSVVEPLPAGVWIRPLDSADDQRALLISGLVPQRDLMTVVLGSPRSRPVPMAEVVRFCHSVPEQHRDRLRFVQYGSVEVWRSSAGQALADQLGAPITFYAGMPSQHGTLHVVAPDGRLGWRSFARELRYQPRTAATGAVVPPQLLAYDSPVGGASELSRGVYWCASDAVVEVVQSGLWLRPPVAPMHADYVRSAPIDPRHGAVVFDTASRQQAERMHKLAGDLVATLDPAMRRMFRVLPANGFVGASTHVPLLSPAPASHTVHETTPGRWSAPSESLVPLPAAEDVFDLDAPTLSAPMVKPPVSTRPPTPARHPEPVVESAATESPSVEIAGTELAVDVPSAAMPVGLSLESSVPDFGIDFAEITPPAAVLVPESLPMPASKPEPATPAVAAERTAVRVQPVPAAAACAVPPARGLAEERAWLRKTLSAQYDVAASTVSRMLSEVPGLRVGTQADDVLADLVGVRLYLTGDSAGVDEAVRSAAPGSHVPLARVAASGLKRLPSYRGATQLWASVGSSELDWYRDRLLVSEWAFLTATMAGQPARWGEVEFRVWSMTARRTQLIAPSIADQVLYLPGTNFKVIEVRDEPTPVVLLRELSTAEIGEDGKVNIGRCMFDDLALGGLDQAAQAWSQVSGADPARPTASAPPGLLSTATGRTEA